MKTRLSIKDEKFLINNALVYSEIPGTSEKAHGLLFNARFIQGIFDDKEDNQRFARFGKNVFDPEQHTDALIAALPQWYKYGLRAFTTGFQGGGPCFTIDNFTIDNNPFGADGKVLDPAYTNRMDRLIKAADEIGMVVIVSFFYGDQTRWFENEDAIKNAVKTGCRFLKEGGYTNVIIEVANEHNLPLFKDEILRTTEGIIELMQLAREEVPGIPVGCSCDGGSRNQAESEAADVILIHGNGQTRQNMYNLIKEIQGWNLNKPILCNEDSQCIGNMEVSFVEGVSWGYYNNLTKQEPPVDWTITTGEDMFFTRRMASLIGLDVPELPHDEFFLQGFENEITSITGERWIRLAALYPENIDYVEFYCDGKYMGKCYGEPFPLKFITNWIFGSTKVASGQQWEAVIYPAGNDAPVKVSVACP